jgi:Putative zinc-finger
MNCEKSRELFVDYIGEELSRADTKQLKDHLEHCQGCRQELALLTKTKTTLRMAWPDEPIPQNLTFDFAESRPGGFWSHVGGFRAPKVVTASLTATVCLILCLVTLSLVRTQIQFANGSLKISFGRSDQPVPAGTVYQPSTGHAQMDGSSRSVEDLNQALRSFEENQAAKLQQALLEMKSESEAKRSADLRRIARAFKYFESTQNVVMKEALRNKSIFETLARDLYVRTNSPSPIQQ